MSPRQKAPPRSSPISPPVVRSPATVAATPEQLFDAALPKDLSAPAGAGPREKVSRPSYLKLAFGNPYNLSLLAGGLAASAITLNPVPAVVSIGLEALWLLHAPDSKFLRRFLWDPRLKAVREAQETAERRARVEGLSTEARDRVEALAARREEIERLAAQNPSFTGELMRSELSKADRLVAAFVDLSVGSARYRAYLASIDDFSLQQDVDKYTAAVRSGAPDDPRTALSKKNLAILLKRQEQMKELKRYLDVVTGQLDLIENSFQLIADQIVTMQSPQELSGQLDELLGGVEAVRETARDTEELLGDGRL